MLRQRRGEYARDGERGRMKEGVSDYVSKKGMLDSVLKKLWHKVQKFPNSKLPTPDSRHEIVERERERASRKLKNYSEGK